MGRPSAAASSSRRALQPAARVSSSGTRAFDRPCFTMWRARLSTCVRELRFHVDPVRPSSAGLREWIDRDYAFTKRLNPTLPFLVRDAPDIEPVVFARYDWGQEVRVPASDFTAEQIDETLKKFVEASKDMPRSPESRPDDVDITDSVFYKLYRKGPTKVSLDKY